MVSYVMYVFPFEWLEHNSACSSSTYPFVYINLIPDVKVGSPYAFLKSLSALAQQHNHLNKHSNFQMPKEASKLKQLPLTSLFKLWH